MTITVIKIGVAALSFISLSLSLIFLLLPRLYLRLDEMFSLNFLPESEWLTTLEGKMDILNDWVIKNRIIFGTLFVVLSLYNIKTVIAL